MVLEQSKPAAETGLAFDLWLTPPPHTPPERLAGVFSTPSPPLTTTMAQRQPNTETVRTLREVEFFLVKSPRGLTIKELTNLTGCSRKTLDRHLQTLQDLGSGLTMQWEPGPHSALWIHRNPCIFRHPE